MKRPLIKTLTAIMLFAIPSLGFGQIAPNLKSAADFAILAGTGISFNGTQTVINNLDVGLYPGFLSSITGNYAINGGSAIAADSPNPAPAILIQAKDDLTQAYLFAKGSTSPAPATVSGNLFGQTLAPGIYKSTSTLEIGGGSLTLNGGPNDVWIFQVESALTTTAGGNVVLTGGALAKNVFWQVGSSATIGNGTTFNGNILALSSITVNTGATVNGRALAINGAVTFAGEGIMNKPADGQTTGLSISVTKTATPKIFAAVGDVILYDIVVTNTGLGTITNVVVTDPTATITGGTPIASLAPGATATVTASYQITPANLSDGFAINIATATKDAVQATAYEIVTTQLPLGPPPPIPLSRWALILGGILIAGFMVFQYRRSMLKV